MALKVGELFASFNIDTSGIDEAVKSAEAKMSNIGKNLAIGGAAMTAAVTVPISKAATAIYEAGTEFDAEMAKVFAIAGDSVTGSAEAMEALRSKALEMGSTTQFTAKEAGEALEYMAMAGWKSNQMIAAIEPIMNLAAAAGTDLGTTSDIVTDAMTAFGISVTDTWKTIENGTEIDTGINNVEHFADILAAASSNANTNVAMLGESFKYAAPVAGTLGINAEDTAIALGLMANAGIKASQAGTSLRTGLTNMVKPSKQMREAMEKYGIGLVQNKDGSVNLRETMIQLRKTMSGMTETEQAAAAAAVFGKHSMAGWLAIVNASDEDFNKLTSAIDGATGSAEKMKQVMLDNAKGDVTIFKSALEGLEITLWSLGENGFRKVVQDATKLVDSFRNADKSTQLGTLKILGLSAAIGPVMGSLGGIVALLPTLAKTFTLVSGPAALLTFGLLALGAAAIDSNNDIGNTFVIGMTKAGDKMRSFGGDVEKQLPTLTTNMSKFLASLSTGIKSGLPSIIGGLTSIITTGVKAISDNMPEIANVSQTIVTTLADSIQSNAPKIVPAVLDLLTNMTTALISNVPVVLEGMSTVITSLISEVNKADWSDIGNKLGESIRTSMSEVGTWFKKLAMGDQYKDDASWTEVGSAMVNNLIAGMKTVAGNSKNFIGSLLLGSAYNPDDSFAVFGSKIIDKIFEGADGAATGAMEFVSGILGKLTDVFSDANISSATEALKTIAVRIINGVANEIPKLAGHATTIMTKLSELMIGDGTSKGAAASATEGASKLAGSIITAITNAIPTALDAAGNVLNAGLTLGAKLMDSISGSFDAGGMDLNVQGIVQSLINNVVKVLSGVIDFGNGAVTAGTRIAVELLNSLAGAFDGAVSTNGVSVIGEKVKSLAQNIINGIVTILPRAFEVGGKAISAGMKLASELVKSLAEGFSSGEGLNVDLAGVAQRLVGGIVEAVGNLPAFLGDVLSAGAQIANSIMDSIVKALTDMEASGVATSLGNAAVNLIKGLLTSVKDFENNPNVKSFMSNLGKGLSAAMSMLGDIAGEIISYILSPEGLSNLWNAGVALGGLLIDGIFNVLGGIGKFFNNIIEKTLDNWGIIDLEKIREENQQLAKECDYAVNVADLFTDSMNNALKDGNSSANIISALFGYGINQLSGINNLDDIAPGLKDSIDSVWKELWMMDSQSVTPGAVKGAMQPLLESYGIALEDVSDDLWKSLVTLLGKNDVTNQNELMKLILSNVLGIDPEKVASQVAEVTGQVVENSAQAAEEAKKAAIQKAQKAVPETLKDNETDIMSAANSASQAGVDALQTTLTNGQEPVSTAAYQLGNVAVQQFLLTLSSENGTAIADAFVGGISTVFSNDGTIEKTATIIATNARNAVQQILTYATAFRIGLNFGQGLVNGINAMIKPVSDAAAAMGNAAAGSLSESIQESSPSRLTAETGTNFGLGFINAILNSADAARNAAALMGLSANDSLTKSMSDVSLTAADQMSVTGRNGLTDSRDAESERHAMAIGAVIAEALNGARVEMNGVLVGQLVTDTVSEGIADRYSGRRYGTV